MENKELFKSTINFKFYKKELNPDIDINKITRKSGKKLNFQCPECKHLFINSPHGLKNCKFCEHQDLCNSLECQLCYNNSFASKCFISFEKFTEYNNLNDGEKINYISGFNNKCALFLFIENNISPRNIFKNTSKEYLFKCWNCKHSFLNKPCKVDELKNCPYCSPKNAKLLCPKEKNCKLCYEKSFASHPKSKCWNYSNDKNESKTPYDVFKGGTHYADLICDNCEHPFQAKCNNILSGFWCPYCAGQKRCDNLNCKLCNDKKLSSHEIIKFWNKELNKDVNPENISLGNSRIKVWINCPNDKHIPFEITPSHIARGQGCPLCVRKTEAKIGEFLTDENFGEIKKEYMPLWIRPKRYDFFVNNIIIELDGLQHFQDSRWGSTLYDCDENINNDIYKMKKANENNISGCRLYQPDVFNDKINWKKFIRTSLKIISENKTNIWIFPNNEIYNKHIEMCVKEKINYKII